MTGVLECEGVDCSVDDDDGVVHSVESEEGDEDGNSSGVKGKNGGDRL